MVMMMMMMMMMMMNKNHIKKNVISYFNAFACIGPFLLIPLR